jgi:hypothetical protein
MNRKWDVGHAGTLALGYGLPFGLRAELEGFHRQNRNGTGSAFYLVIPNLRSLPPTTSPADHF